MSGILSTRSWWAQVKEAGGQVPHAASLVRVSGNLLDIPPPPAIKIEKTCERGNKEIHGNGDGWKNLETYPEFVK